MPSFLLALFLAILARAEVSRFLAGISTRRAVWAAINESGVAADLANGQRRRDVWRQMAGHGFVVSPVGHGLDSHRTWEALSLGCIVLVEKSPLDSLYQVTPS